MDIYTYAYNNTLACIGETDLILFIIMARMFFSLQLDIIVKIAKKKNTKEKQNANSKQQARVKKS